MANVSSLLQREADNWQPIPSIDPTFTCTRKTIADWIADLCMHTLFHANERVFTHDDILRQISRQGPDNKR